MTNAPLVPVSWGELIDKITILEIKSTKITAQPANANVKRELELLMQIAAGSMADARIAPLAAELRDVNLRLWDIEDRIREKEAGHAFDQEFIDLARSVYVNNDERAKIKKKINLGLSSDLVEEKSYQNYTR